MLLRERRGRAMRQHHLHRGQRRRDQPRHEHGLGREEYEFQLLLGGRSALGGQIVRGGHRLRIYTPFGEHWYACSLRRLQENPKIAGYIAADTVGRLIHGRNGSS